MSIERKEFKRVVEKTKKRPPFFIKLLYFFILYQYMSIVRSRIKRKDYKLLNSDGRKIETFLRLCLKMLFSEFLWSNWSHRFLWVLYIAFGCHSLPFYSKSLSQSQLTKKAKPKLPYIQFAFQVVIKYMRFDQHVSEMIFLYYICLATSYCILLSVSNIQSFDPYSSDPKPK